MSSHPSKRRKLADGAQSSEGPATSDVKIQKQFFKSAQSWNLEEDYENRPRKGKQKKQKKLADATKLPIRAAPGTWVTQEEEDAEIASDAEWLESEGEEAPEEEEAQPEPEAPKIPEKEQIRRAQEEMAKIATQLNEDPEEHPGAFKALAKFSESDLLAIKKLAIVVQMTVYKDVIPGYRIRPASEDVAKEKLSKDVKRLRVYEQAMVTGYHQYLKTLATLAGGAIRDKGAKQPITSIALTCACTLLNAVPHFNFRSELLKIIIKKLSYRNIDKDFVKCRTALETLFHEDEDGQPAMEAISVLTKMMKARNYQVDESILNLFLHLRLLDEFSGKASRDTVEKTDDGSVKKQKQKKEFRTKRERKLLKEQKEAEKVMAHADAAVSHEERERMQSETLKMVFASYFRILKMRIPNLMGACLEGLARYSHLINQDFFGDLLEALKDLIRYSEMDANKDDADSDDEEKEEEEDEDDEHEFVRDTSREALLCTVTAFALLEGQDAHNARSDLHLDLSFFITHLFQSLLSLSVNPDLELGAQSLQLQNSVRRNNRINLQTTTVLLIKCLSGILLPPWNIRSVAPLRLAAFTKQLMSGSLQVPEKSAQALLGLLADVLHTHGRKISSLWNTEERKGDGTYKPLAATVEGSNPFASTVWEGELLRKHYCPKVRESVKELEKSIKSIK